MEKEDLVAIANTAMPFGKYQGRMLIDLPEPYLLWFARKGEFPEGRLGQLMSLALAGGVKAPRPWRWAGGRAGEASPWPRPSAADAGVPSLDLALRLCAPLTSLACGRPDAVNALPGSRGCPTRRVETPGARKRQVPASR